MRGSEASWSFRRPTYQPERKGKAIGADLYRSDHPAQDPVNTDRIQEIRDKIGEIRRDDPGYEALRESYDDLLDMMYRNDNDLTYFRDSYNDSSLFNKLGLSWWSDLAPHLGPDSGSPDLYPDGAALLRQECIRRAEFMEQQIEHMEDNTKTYFQQKLVRFIRFLDEAAKGGHTIYCSY